MGGDYTAMEPLKPSIIAVDLDDTLLRPDLSISGYTVRTLEAVREAGIHVVPASGRALQAVKPFAEILGIAGRPGYYICSNGSQVITADTEEGIYERKLPVETAVKAFRMCLDAGLSCHVYQDGEIYVSRETEYSARDSRLSGLAPVIPADYEELLGRGVFKLVIPGDEEFLVPLVQEFKVELAGEAVVFVSKPYFLEVLPPGAGKGEALRFLAEEVLGLKAGDVMAFGDSMNDESMIRYARHSVAMVNGLDEIKGLARYVTERSNAEDGVADFIASHVSL